LGRSASGILAGVIVEQFVRRADGEPEPMTDGSTRPVAAIAMP
jgi:hypothetical protein